MFQETVCSVFFALGFAVKVVSDGDNGLIFKILAVFRFGPGEKLHMLGMEQGLVMGRATSSRAESVLDTAHELPILIERQF